MTGPVVKRLTRYSRRGPAPPGVCRGAVTGHGSIPAPVRPMPGMRCQPTPPAPTTLLWCSASIETYPLASTNPVGRPPFGLSTTARTTTVRPSGPVTVTGTSVVPRGARDQSTRRVTRSCCATLPRVRSALSQATPVLIR